MMPLFKLVGAMWHNINGKMKLVYDEIAARMRNDPFPGLRYSFEDIQEYKR